MYFFCNVGDLAPVVKLVDKETILKERAAKLAVSFLKKKSFLTFHFLQILFKPSSKIKLLDKPQEILSFQNRLIAFILVSGINWKTQLFI